MILKNITLRGFRNIRECEVNFGSRFNVLFGNNGQGKTNILEAIYASCALRSFRTSRLKDLISIHSEQAYVSSWVHREGLERQYELTISNRSRVIRLDGKTVRPLKKYFGKFQVVLFAPEDLMIPKGSPSLRRRFLDRSVFTLNPDFLQSAQEFEKTLKSRNTVLKDIVGAGKKRDLLDVYDEQLAMFGAKIVRTRLGYIDNLRTSFQQSYEAITQSGLSVDIVYKSEQQYSSKDEDELRFILLENIKKARAHDLMRGQSSIGPHRDDLQFFLEGQDASNFASQGQLRAMILAWKHAEMKTIRDHSGHHPILLLDDVSSELDPNRNKSFFSLLNQDNQQCFITTTHSDFVKLNSDRQDFQICEGRITKVD